MLFDPELFDPPLFEEDTPSNFVTPVLLFPWQADDNSAPGSTTNGYEFTSPVKDPDALLRHGHDLTKWLQEGETITGTPTVTASPAGLTISGVAVFGGIVSYSVEVGANGATYIVTCRVTTTRGGVTPYRIDDRSIRYRVGER